VDRVRLGEITPEKAAGGAVGFLPDGELPMLGALWLTQDFDSEELRQLAGLNKSDGAEARRQLPSVLASLGHTQLDSGRPFDQLPWRGYWQSIEWAQRVVDDLLSPYAAAQRVIEVAGDVDGLWEPAGAAVLMGQSSARLSRAR
jgi:hypothetical protein